MFTAAYGGGEAGVSRRRITRDTPASRWLTTGIRITPAYHAWYAGFAVADDGHPVDDSCHHCVVD